MEQLFSLLFKYRPVVFERGTLAFDLPVPLGVFLLGGAGLVLLTTLPYRRTSRLDGRERLLLAGLRAAAVVILVFCLARPMLIVPTVVPQENFLGVLVDDSRSMGITDWNDSARSAFVTEQLGPDGELYRSLADRFKLRFFRFSQSAGRVSGVSELTYDGRRTDLARGLETARRELAAVPLAGLVVVSDGATGAETPLQDALLEIAASGVPVNTVGVGRETFDRDIAVGRVSAPRRVLQGSAVAVDVAVRQHGFGGQTVTLVVEDAGRILTTREVELPRNRETTSVRVHFTADDPGARLLTFRIDPREGETVTQNNTTSTLIDVQDGRPTVLYFEGEPRWEVAFLRRAIANDEHVRVVVLQRTAPDKFLRLDVQEPDELAGGFPTTRAELFRYEGLILGSVEASFFTRDQLDMIADFVSRRGGGLLLLGGRHALSEGGYAGTPVADALPVVLAARPNGADSSTFVGEVTVEPTPYGRTHAVTQLSSSVDSSDARWRTLPPLTAVNRVTELKPGARALLTGDVRDLDDPLIVLAYQRYGKGKALTFAVQDSWLWQMHADIPLEDMTHETLWQQLLRWLVSDVPAPVSVTTADDRVEQGTPISVTAQVSDSGYLALNGARVTAEVTSPTGETREMPLEWTVERDGEYRLAFTPDESGLYEISVHGEQSGMALGDDVAYVESGDLNSEYVDAEMHRSVLELVAEETGGRFYTPETVASLPEDVSFTESGAVVHEERDLWDMPVVFLALVALVGTEWGYRRRRGLA